MVVLVLVQQLGLMRVGLPGSGSDQCVALGPHTKPPSLLAAVESAAVPSSVRPCLLPGRECDSDSVGESLKPPRVLNFFNKLNFVEIEDTYTARVTVELQEVLSDPL